MISKIKLLLGQERVAINTEGELVLKPKKHDAETFLQDVAKCLKYESTQKILRV